MVRRREFNFCQTFLLHPAGPPRGSGWGFTAYIGMQSAHFRAIYSYIWKHDVRFILRARFSAWLSGLEEAAVLESLFAQFWETEDERMLSTHSQLFVLSRTVININLTNVTSLHFFCQSKVLYIIIVHFTTWTLPWKVVVIKEATETKSISFIQRYTNELYQKNYLTNVLL